MANPCPNGDFSQWGAAGFAAELIAADKIKAAFIGPDRGSFGDKLVRREGDGDVLPSSLGQTNEEELWRSLMK